MKHPSSETTSGGQLSDKSALSIMTTVERGTQPTATLGDELKSRSVGDLLSLSQKSLTWSDQKQPLKKAIEERKKEGREDREKEGREEREKKAREEREKEGREEREEADVKKFPSDVRITITPDPASEGKQSTTQGN